MPCCVVRGGVTLHSCAAWSPGDPCGSVLRTHVVMRWCMLAARQQWARLAPGLVPAIAAAGRVQSSPFSRLVFSAWRHSQSG
jgi:hypothetical protein